MRPDVMTRRLRQHGIFPRQARNSALAAWATDLPAAIVADLLGINVNTAVDWAARTRRDWTDYIAARATQITRRTHTPDQPPTGNTAPIE
jgi:hypothetical protein